MSTSKPKAKRETAKLKTDEQTQAEMVKRAEAPGPRTEGTTATNHERQQAGPPANTMRPLSVPEDPAEERSRLIDPRTSMSSGDPPAALTPAGERLGTRIGDPMLEKHQGHSEPIRGPEGPTKATREAMHDVGRDVGADPKDEESRQKT